MKGDQDAISVAERLLDTTGDALMRGDFASFEPCFLLPQTVESFDGIRHLRQREDLKDLFDEVQSHFDRIGLTDCVRCVVSASFKDETTIVSTHESRLLCHGLQLYRPPYPVYSILKHCDDGWRISDSKYAINGDDRHARLFGKLPEKPSD